MTLSTRVSVRHEALRRAGGFVEDLTGTPDGTTAASEDMQYRFGGDDDAGKGMTLYEPTSAAVDRFRVTTTWDDSAGQATVDTIATPWSEADTVEYYLRNDPTPQEFNDAINRTLSETKRIVETVIPTVESTRNYGLNNLPWIDKRDDIISVLFRNSNNVLDNSQFELWGRGQDAQLHAWVLSSADDSGTVSRVDGLQERFAARLTRAGTDVTMTQTIPIPITQIQGEEFSVFGNVRCSTASVAKIRITDGTDTTDTSFHTGTTALWEELRATHTVNANAVGPLQVQLLALTSDTNADFENVVLVEDDSVVEWLEDYGDQSAPASHVRWSAQMRGSIPVIVTDRKFNRKSQLVVQSLQRYFELTADSSTGGVTDMPFEALVAGTLVKLAETHAVGKPNAARWEQIGSYWLPKYRSWQRSLAEPSKRPTPRRQEVLSV